MTRCEVGLLSGVGIPKLDTGYYRIHVSFPPQHPDEALDKSVHDCHYLVISTPYLSGSVTE